MIIMPPLRTYRRPRAWNTFEQLFEPIPKAEDSLLHDIDEFRVSAKGSRHWWTVVEGDSGGLYVIAGVHVVNRIGLLLSPHLWGGEWAEHPEYRYM